MTVLRIEDGDLYLPDEADRLQVLAEPAATLQALRDALRVAVGDWFLDVTAGVNRLREGQQVRLLDAAGAGGQDGKKS